MYLYIEIWSFVHCLQFFITWCADCVYNFISRFMCSVVQHIAVCFQSQLILRPVFICLIILLVNVTGSKILDSIFRGCKIICQVLFSYHGFRHYVLLFFSSSWTAPASPNLLVHLYSLWLLYTVSTKNGPLFICPITRSKINQF